MPHANLHAFVAWLRQAPIVPRPPEESWDAMIWRSTQTGVVCVIDEETYDYFLDVLPPRYHGNGFAFAEGAEPLRLFWHIRPEAFFCRQLTWDETRIFCQLAHIPLPV